MDSLGITKSLINNFDLYADNVYQKQDGSYEFYIHTADEESGVNNVITCKADKDFKIRSIYIETFTPTDVLKNEYRVERCYVSYQNINAEVEITPPKTLVEKGYIINQASLRQI